MVEPRPYRLAGRLDLLPEDIWAGLGPTIYLPPVPETSPEADPILTVIDEAGRERPLAWPGGLALEAEETADHLIAWAAFRIPRPLVSRLPFHPHRLPSFARALGRRMWGRRGGRAGRQVYPRWPVEPSLEIWRAVVRAAGREAGPAGVTWPEGADYGLILSHDVDTAAGQRNAPALAEIEESLGFRSAWFLPADNFALDFDLWRELGRRGHEIACHGLKHDFKLAYLPRNALAGRLDEALAVLARLKPTGFRSPGFFRTPALIDALAGRFGYDSSIPDTRSLPAPNGCAAIRPFKLGGLTQLPVTLPPEGEMMALGYDRTARAGIWAAKANWIARRGGLVHLLTHPDPGFTDRPAELELYRNFLAELAGGRLRYWTGLPREAAALMA